LVGLLTGDKAGDYIFDGMQTSLFSISLATYVDGISLFTLGEN